MASVGEGLRELQYDHLTRVMIAHCVNGHHYRIPDHMCKHDPYGKVHVPECPDCERERAIWQKREWEKRMLSQTKNVTFNPIDIQPPEVTARVWLEREIGRVRALGRKPQRITDKVPF